MVIAFFGNNSFKDHKRGVENVVHFQAKAYGQNKNYYIHWGNITTSYKSNDFICISIQNCWYWPVLLNIVLFKIKIKNQFIIHSHNPLFSIFCILKTTVLTVHDGLYYLSKEQKKKRLPIFWIFEKILYLRCSKVHFISNFTKNQTLFGNRKNYSVIPNSSHFEEFVVDDFTNQIIQHSYVLIVRSIEERARFDLLIEVAKLLPDRQFIVAGKGPLFDYYISIIKSTNITNLLMLGYVTDSRLIRLYTNCELVLNIADYGEGFGLPIIEGYLFNKPVIGSNKCAIPEVIISEEYLFENTVSHIKEKIEGVRKIKLVNYRAFYNLKFSNEKVAYEIRKLIAE